MFSPEPKSRAVLARKTVCVCVSLSLSLYVAQLAPLCGLLFWSFMLTLLLLLLLLVFLFTSSAHFAAFSPASAPFGAIVLVKLTICIQLRYALCPAADEARLSSQKYAQDAHSDSSPLISLPVLPLLLTPCAFVGSFIFICFVITIFIPFFSFGLCNICAVIFEFVVVLVGYLMQLPQQI